MCWRRPATRWPAATARIIDRSSIVRAGDRAATLDDLRGRVFGCNSRRSNTGMNLPRLSLARIADRRRFFSNVVVTGGHLHSLELLSAGSIDLCSVDCVTWVLPGAFPAGDDSAKGAFSQRRFPSPSLPFVTTSATSSQAKAALRQALHQISVEPRLRPTHVRLSPCAASRAWRPRLTNKYSSTSGKPRSLLSCARMTTCTVSVHRHRALHRKNTRWVHAVLGDCCRTVARSFGAGPEGTSCLASQP